MANRARAVAQRVSGLLSTGKRSPWSASSLLAFLVLSAPPSLFAAADLSISKSALGGVKPGTDLAYTIVVTNLGPDTVADAVVADGTPAGLTFVANSGDCTTAFPCNLATLVQGQQRTIIATFHVPTGYSGVDPIVNVASVSSASTTDPVPGNNTATASTALTRVQGFYSLPPCRLADTRGTSGVPIGGPRLAAGGIRTINVRELCGLPGNAVAISYNVTVTGATSAGDLRLFPGGSPSFSSVINYLSGQTRANNGVVPLASDGSIGVQCDQASGTTEFILDVNGYFAVSDLVPTPVGQKVRVRPAPEVEITFDAVAAAGGTGAHVIEFADNRPGAVDQSLQDFFPPGSPLRALVPSVIVPSFVKALGKGGPAGTPTFVLSLVDTSAQFARTAEFHGFEDFRLGWDPPCVVAADPTQEPRTFYAPEALKGEPSLVEDVGFGGPVFVDISSGCGSNKGSGWNFSLYLTGKDTRTPLEVARYMLQRMQDALSALAASITNPTASNLLTEVQAALSTLDTNATASLANMNNFINLVDANPAAFNNTARNVSGELAGRALSARYMLSKVPGLPSGTINEFPVLTAGSQLWGIAAGPDGNVWFAERIVNKIGRITPTGVVTEFTVPTATSQPDGLAGGPDGNVWFTEDAGNKVGKITPAGAITEFAVPTGGSSPTAIVTGPDSNLWFTERVANRIGRITTAGVFTEFTIPTAGSGPDGIAAGPDGNLWFVENGANKIGRVTTAGTMTEFPVPTVNSGPQDMFAGPDGNLWFTEANANKIGRITISGAITEFPIPTVNSGPFGITAGPDGNLWFIERTNKVGRITTLGVITEFVVPQGGQLREIAKGADGNLWFTETNGNRIGRIVP
jgi:uncharacterized repeat protein (TIGR01451 family)